MDIQEFKGSLETAIDFFDKHEISLLKGQEVARALCILSLSSVENGIDVRNIYFDYQEIYKAVWGSEVEANKASQMVRKHSDIIKGCFEADSELNTHLNANGNAGLNLQIESTKGGHKTQIFLLSREEKSKDLNRQGPIHVISYSPVQLPKVYSLTKPFLDLRLQPLVFTAFAMILITIAVVAFFSFIGFINWGSKPLNIVIILSMFPAGYVLLKIHEIMEKGVTSLPIFMAPVTTRNAMLVLTKERQNDQVALKMKAIVYDCKCGMCGENILIEKSREFRGRYIGKCAVAPTEHIYSFDHVLKTGKFLR
ncbi:hypothetical protein ACFOEW_03455 [Alteromonas oceani]|uniref:Uncharacterized protein n=1 Tax=Alteromonas oceani TaxID=2071609 RepID=A0ABV7JVY4_9ALTE|nr:hypothetical protein [Alteromonas oceani]